MSDMTKVDQDFEVNKQQYYVFLLYRNKYKASIIFSDSFLRLHCYDFWSFFSITFVLKYLYLIVTYCLEKWHYQLQV